MYDEQSHQLFIQTHLDDMLNIIAETTGEDRRIRSISTTDLLIDSSSSESAQSATLTMDAITALSYIFEGTLHDNLRKIVPLHVILQNPSIQQEIGVVRNVQCLFDLVRLEKTFPLE